MPDERLARWAARGSEAAFAVIFERHHQALHRYCHSIVGNGHDASDALQSTMLKAFRALPGETREITLRPGCTGSPTTSRSRCCARAARTRDLDAAAHVGDPATEGLIESRDRLRALAADLTELTEQQRGALLMRELGGLDFAEIAAALEISAAAAKQSVYESRCVLQALQEGRDMDCDLVRRTLSDGDRRMLRGKKLRGHLRSCAGCQDFERALHERPAHLAALAPPLPLAAAAAMLSGLLGGGGAAGGFGAGGGLIAGLTGGAKGIAGVSLATKVATVAVVGTTIVGGGALVVVPDRGASGEPRRPQPRAAPGRQRAAAARAQRRRRAISAAHAADARGRGRARARGRRAQAGRSRERPARAGAGAARRATAPVSRKARATSAAARARRGGPATTPAARRAERAAIARGRSAAPSASRRSRPRQSRGRGGRARTRAKAKAKAKAKAEALGEGAGAAQRARAGAVEPRPRRRRRRARQRQRARAAPPAEPALVRDSSLRSRAGRRLCSDRTTRRQGGTP